MIALIPAEQDAARLAVDGGLPAEELHLTLAYLGKADTIDADTRHALVDAVTKAVDGLPAIEGQAFAPAVFNPGSDEPCRVLVVGGDLLDAVHHFLVETIALPPADRHAPWLPHITIAPDGAFDQLEDLADRIGPVRFDRLRIAFAGENVDIPLAGNNEQDSEQDDGPDGDWSLVEADGDNQLKRWWVFGKGLKKWAFSKHPWTALFRHLRKHLDPERAKRVTSAWYKLHFGHMPNQRHAEASTAPTATLVEVTIVESGGFEPVHPDDVVDAEPLGDDELILLAALGELDAELVEVFDPSQARYPKGHPLGGKFRPMVDRVKDSITAHRRGEHGDKHPLDGYSREQLRKVAKARGIELKRGEDRDAIAKKLLADFGDKNTKSAKNTKTTSNPEQPAKPKPAPKAKAEPTPAERIAAGDFSQLKQVGEQGGSNPGGVFEAPDGSRWYVKAQKSPEHAANEALSSALYRATGVDAPEVVRGSGTPGLPGDNHTASRLVDGATSDLGIRLDDDAYLAQIRAGFATDAWLGNWDVAGAAMDNVVTGADGKPWRIDLGGSLLYRAQGEPKGAAFGDSVSEWMTLRDKTSAPQASKLFTGMPRADMVASVEQLSNVSPEEIRRLAGEHGLPHVADVLIRRRQQLLDRLPRLRQEADRQRAFDASAANALEGSAALEVVPVRLPVGAGMLDPAPAGWSSTQVYQSAVALDDYRGAYYGPINSYLRGTEPEADELVRQVAGIDAALRESRLPQDMIAYRGVNHPSTVFGTAWNSVDVVGLEWDDLAFASTSADRRVAEKFAHNGVVMRILLPKGTGAVRLSDFAPDGTVPAGIPQEAEVLASRGQRRRVVADHGVDKHGRRILDVEVIDV
ncbi:hypothetical protein Dfulv_17225 [Dactylosporangium fulvum]|uniref:ADP ribosyltransferase domain-containing protein n=2 Tax=Dactylosporangium fulvum TaxID=53359 RepID=A0ABY5W953_9ACTN|nr:ADP-ribosyltransferase [Dactylosporangium fulvum]UWP85890.1 hypothetical protein Dfulv_17225 [Dactylosporangium fulvum]